MEDRLRALEERVRAHIPLAAHLGFRLERHQPGELILHAPLEPNINDKGTFFAGSQAALLALAGWALTTLEAEGILDHADVVAVECSLKHLAPARFDARLEARATGAALERFHERLARRGRGKLELQVELLGPAGEQATTYQGLYMARQLEEGE
jgi:thioesterase domain-containing protein